MNDVQTLEANADVRISKVRIPSGGVSLAADLYEPIGPASSAGYPALVIGHGFSFVKEGLQDQGHFFAKAGYVTLAIDYLSTAVGFHTSGAE